MNLAYSAAHGSKCLKRQVGAVLVNAPPGNLGDVVGVGFNENPPPTKPCVEDPSLGFDPSLERSGVCYRERLKTDLLQKLAAKGRYCPGCGQKIVLFEQRRCESCRSDLEEFFWVERAMTWCTAIHAEVAAIMAAGLRARDTTLYTTTFPCFQCAEKIAQAGVAEVVFTEPYPDVAAAGRLDAAGIMATRFEGVRSRRFDDIFAEARKTALHRTSEKHSITGAPHAKVEPGSK